MNPVCPVQCSFNLRERQLALYVLAFVVDYPYTGWFKRTDLYNDYYFWKKTQEKGLSLQQCLVGLSDDRFYKQLDRLSLDRRYQGRWIYCHIPEVPTELCLSFSKAQDSDLLVFHLIKRPYELLMDLAVATMFGPEPSRTVEVTATAQQDSPPPNGSPQAGSAQTRQHRPQAAVTPSRSAPPPQHGKLP